MGKTVQVELPEQPDWSPQISEVRERLATLEERTTHGITDPAAAEALSLASEAHRLLGEMAGRVQALESAAERVPAQVENELPTSPVVELPPPPALPEPEPTTEPIQTVNPEPHHPWWHPARYL